MSHVLRDLPTVGGGNVNHSQGEFRGLLFVLLSRGSFPGLSVFLMPMCLSVPLGPEEPLCSSLGLPPLHTALWGSPPLHTALWGSPTLHTALWGSPTLHTALTSVVLGPCAFTLLAPPLLGITICQCLPSSVGQPLFYTFYIFCSRFFFFSPHEGHFSPCYSFIVRSKSPPMV